MSGFSGCKVLLCEEDNCLFVRKISGNENYNERLRLQMEKQKSFKSAFVNAPSIIGSGYQNDLFYFDMEYLQGITLAEKLKTIRVCDIRKYVDIIGNFLVEHDAISTSQVAEDAFKIKIEQLSKELVGRGAVVNEAIELLKKHDWKKMPSSFCHGDLTLENIIIHSGNLYLIDFLDSFYDSWILDAATLLQDSKCLWAFRNYDKINNNTLVRMMVFSDLLLDCIRYKHPEIINDIYCALLLKLVRILPYCSDNRTEIFLKEKIEMIMKLIKKEEKL